jgi:hypothetical protein
LTLLAAALFSIGAAVISIGYVVLRPSNIVVRVADVPTDLQEGDILFRRGTGWEAEVVTAANSASNSWTHVGVVIRDEHTADFLVVHADNERGVVADGIERYASEASTLARVRLELKGGERKKLVEFIRSQLGKPFDNFFSFRDEAQALYCTELVELALREASFSSGVVARPIAFLMEAVIFPQDLYVALTDRRKTGDQTFGLR